MLAGMFLFLARRAADDYHWSGWAFGDAQTMLSSRQWNEGGWIENKLLFSPQGYAKAIVVLDEPELRHHAHGTYSGSKDKVGPRRLYTHYPPGYLLPYAALYRIGLTTTFAARVVSLCFSVGAVFLFYALLVKLFSRGIALVAAAAYIAAAQFRDFADSIANHPADDLLRFASVFAIVLAVRSPSARIEWRYDVVAWVLLFVLTLTSLDSLPFVCVWLVGYPWLERSKMNWKKLAVFALAPLLGGALLFAQNAWYLGMRDAWRDATDILLHQGSVGASGEPLWARLRALAAISDHLLGWLWMIGLILGGVMWLRRQPSAEKGQGRIIGLLLISGLAFVVFLPRSAIDLSYEGRQVLPFVAVLVACLSVALAEKSLGALLGGALLFVVHVLRLAADDPSPMHMAPAIIRNHPDIVLARDTLLPLKTRYDPIVFTGGVLSLYWHMNFVPGYPQIYPLVEYYAGSRPILCFLRSDTLGKDLAIMLRKSQHRFSPVIVVPSENALRFVMDALKDAGVLKERPWATATLPGLRIVDLTDYVDWDGFLARG
jgi:hypothetical protein